MSKSVSHTPLPVHSMLLAMYFLEEEQSILQTKFERPCIHPNID